MKTKKLCEIGQPLNFYLRDNEMNCLEDLIVTYADEVLCDFPSAD